MGSVINAISLNGSPRKLDNPLHFLTHNRPRKKKKMKKETNTEKEAKRSNKKNIYNKSAFSVAALMSTDARCMKLPLDSTGICHSPRCTQRHKLLFLCPIAED